MKEIIELSKRAKGMPPDTILTIKAGDAVAICAEYQKLKAVHDQKLKEYSTNRQNSPASGGAGGNV